MALTDTMNATLIADGYTGSIQDKLKAFFRYWGDTEYTGLADAEHSFLLAQGAPEYLQLDDMWSWYLLDLGYTNGSLQEMKIAWWNDGAPVAGKLTSHILLETGFVLLCENGNKLTLE